MPSAASGLALDSCAGDYSAQQGQNCFSATAMTIANQMHGLSAAKTSITRALMSVSLSILDRLGPLALPFLILASVLFEASPSGAQRNPGSSPLVLGSAAISPNGELIAIPASQATGDPARLMLYNRRADTVVAVPSPGNWDIAQPAFSPDGSSLAIFAACAGSLCGAPPDVTRLLELDLKRLTWRTISSAPGVRRSPSYLPDGRHLIVVEAEVTHATGGQVRTGVNGLGIVDVRTGRLARLLPDEERFLYIFDPAVTNAGFVIFSGYSPRRPDLRDEILRLKAPQGLYVPVGWQARLEQHSSVGWGKISSIDMLPFVQSTLPSGVNYLRAALSGTKVFVSRTRKQPAVDGRGGIRYDLFVARDGTVEQVTDSGRFISDVAISGDGNTVLTKQDHPGEEPAYLLVHLPTGRAEPLPLLKKLVGAFR